MEGRVRDARSLRSGNLHNGIKSRQSILGNIQNGWRPQAKHEVPMDTQESGGRTTDTRAESGAESTSETSLEPSSETEVIISDLFDSEYL